MVISILETNNFEITMLFDNFEIKKIDFSYLINSQFQNHKNLLSKDNWDTLELKDGALFFPKFMNGFYVSPETIYQNSLPAPFKPQYISEIRKLKGFSQKDLAKKLKIDQKEISLIELGKLNNLSLINKILNLLL